MMFTQFEKNAYFAYLDGELKAGTIDFIETPKKLAKFFGISKTNSERVYTWWVYSYNKEDDDDDE